MPKKDAYVVFYADEFDEISEDAWRNFCEVVNVSPNATWVKMKFDYKDVTSDC